MAPIPQGANEVIGTATDGRLYVYGGQDPNSTPLGLLWSYTPTTNEWSRLEGNPVPVHHGAMAAVGAKLYLFDGFRLPDTGQDRKSVV